MFIHEQILMESPLMPCSILGVDDFAVNKIDGVSILMELMS